MSLLHDPHHDGSPTLRLRRGTRARRDRHRARPHERSRPGRRGLAADDVRRRAGLPRHDVDRRPATWCGGRASCRCTTRSPTTASSSARRRRRGGRAGVADRRRAGGPRPARRRRLPAGRPPARARLGPRRASSTRCSPTGSPARPPPTSGRSRTGRCRRSGTTRSSSRAATRARRCSSTAATSTASPSTSTTSPRSGPTSLYTTPVFPGESNHRYNATTFTEVDELLGGGEAYARLSAAVHERGWRILGDLTTNHTGDTHEWFLSRRRRRARPAPLLLLLRRRRHLRRTGWATARCPRSTTPTSTCATRWSTAPTPWSVAGCSRPTPSTGGASTSPT